MALSGRWQLFCKGMLLVFAALLVVAVRDLITKSPLLSEEADHVWPSWIGAISGLCLMACGFVGQWGRGTKKRGP
jgi:hypothetical protein